MADYLAKQDGSGHLLLQDGAGGLLLQVQAAGPAFLAAWALNANPASPVMRKNVAGQFVSAHLVSKTDGSDVTTGTTTVSVTLDNGSQTSGGGTVTHKGNGEWSYAPTQAETNGNRASYTFVNSAAVSVTVNAEPVSYDPTNANSLGLGYLTGDAYGIVNDGTNGNAAIKSSVGGVQSTASSTQAIVSNGTYGNQALLTTINGLNNLSAAGVRAAVGLASANLDTQLATIAGYIDTEVGTIVTATAAIKAKTDNLPADPASETNATSNKQAILTAAGSPMQVGTKVVLNATQTDYAPAKAGDAMTLTGAYDAAKTAASSTALAALAAVFSGITSLAQWLGILAGKQAGNSAARTELRATGAGSGTYDETTDSLQAIRDRGDAAWQTGSGGGGGEVSVSFVQAAAATGAATPDAGTIGIRRGDSFSIQLAGLGDLTDRTKLYFTVKASPDVEADTVAVIQVEETGGLLRINRKAPATGITATLVVNDAATGVATIAGDPDASALLPPGTYTYDIKKITAVGAVGLAAGALIVSTNVTSATT